MMARFLLALSAAVAVVADVPPTCLDQYSCVYHAGSGVNEVSWDLRGLCSTSPFGYTAQKRNSDGSLDSSVIFFNLCGNLPTACAPQEIEGGVDPLYSRGSAVQFFEPQCFTNPTDPACPAAGDQCCDVTVDPTCTSSDPSSGIPALKVPCTGNCEVVTQANVAPVFSAFKAGPYSIKPGFAGINLTYPPVPAYGSDNYECPNNPLTNLPYERQLTISLLCDPSSTDLTPSQITLTEPITCSYLIQAVTSAACATKGDTFDCASPTPCPTAAKANLGPNNFGFVCLGSGLTMGVAALYMYGATKGWWDSLAARVSAMRGSTPAGSSTYKTIGTPASSSAGGFSSI